MVVKDCAVGNGGSGFFRGGIVGGLGGCVDGMGCDEGLSHIDSTHSTRVLCRISKLSSTDEPVAQDSFFPHTRNSWIPSPSSSGELLPQLLHAAASIRHSHLTCLSSQ